MLKVNVSSKYQVVIPKEVRNKLNIKKGETLQVVVKNGIINLIPDISIDKLKGFLRGMNIDNIREEEDRSL